MTESIARQVILVTRPTFLFLTIGLAASKAMAVEEVWAATIDDRFGNEKIIFIDMRGGRYGVRRKANRWPHGFHNGQLGSAISNAVGYELICQKDYRNAAEPELPIVDIRLINRRINERISTKLSNAGVTLQRNFSKKNG